MFVVIHPGFYVMKKMSYNEFSFCVRIYFSALKRDSAPAWVFLK